MHGRLERVLASSLRRAVAVTIAIIAAMILQSSALSLTSLSPGLVNTDKSFDTGFTQFSCKLGPIEIELVPRKEVTALNQTTAADLHVRTRVATGPLHVAVSAMGTAIALGPAVLDLGAPGPNAEATASVAYTVFGSGDGELRVTVTGAGWSQSARIYVLGTGGDALHGRSGPLDLRLKRLDRDHASGKLDHTSYAASLDLAAGGGATERASSRRSSDSGSISGIARYTDRVGATHPIRLARVELRDGNSRGFVAETMTGPDGSYTLPTPRQGSFTVRILAQGPGYVIRSPRGTIQHVDSLAHPTGPATELSLDLTANNVDDNNTAFSVADAMLTEDLYVEQLRGSGYPPIEVVFPSFGTFINTSVPVIHLLRLDRFDWDVTMHEFGHYVARNLGIDRSPGGQHGPGCLSGAGGVGKAVSILLAWNEGWVTYFGTAAQQVMGTAALGIPFVGDTLYSDTEDADFYYDLETQTGRIAVFPEFPFLSTSEDDELSVQRILWDLFDTADDDGDHGVALGDGAIIAALQSAQVGSLSEAFAALTSGRPVAEVAEIGCIFTEHRVAPSPTRPADGAVVNSVPPTFEWVPNGGGACLQNNLFVVEIYDASFTQLLLGSAPQSATSFTPTRSQWNAVIRAAGGNLHWLVRGSQLNDPVTGPYVSCARTLAVR